MTQQARWSAAYRDAIEAELVALKAENERLATLLRRLMEAVVEEDTARHDFDSDTPRNMGKAMRHTYAEEALEALLSEVRTHLGEGAKAEQS